MFSNDCLQYLLGKRLLHRDNQDRHYKHIQVSIAQETFVLLELVDLHQPAPVVHLTLSHGVLPGVSDVSEQIFVARL